MTVSALFIYSCSVQVSLEILLRNKSVLTGLEKSGAKSHFATGTRGFATRKLGAVATVRLKPEDQAHHCDQMNR